VGTVPSSLIAKSAWRLICGRADGGGGARKVKSPDLKLNFLSSFPGRPQLVQLCFYNRIAAAEPWVFCLETETTKRELRGSIKTKETRTG